MIDQIVEVFFVPVDDSGGDRSKVYFLIDILNVVKLALNSDGLLL